MLRELQVCIGILHIDVLCEFGVGLGRVCLHGVVGLSLYDLVDSVWVGHESLPVTEESVCSVGLASVLTELNTRSNVLVVAVVRDCPNSSLALALVQTIGTHLGLS